MSKGNKEAYKNSILKKENFEPKEPGENSRFLRHALASYNLPPLDISDPAQVEERIVWYFNHCAEDDMKPTVTGLGNALGVGRSTLYDWANGNDRKNTHKDIIKKAYRIMEELWEGYMANGKINPVSGIFLGKNHFGYKDQAETTVRVQPLTEESADDVRLKYDELPDVE